MRKVLFMLDEIMVDLGFSKKTNGLLWIVTLLGGFCALRFMLLLHIMGQWLILKSLDCPVEKVEHDFISGTITYGVYFDYQQILVVALGPLSNTVIFYFFSLSNRLSQHFIGSFPKYLGTFILWHGFFTMFDFMISAIIDIGNQKTNGDIFKLSEQYG